VKAADGAAAKPAAAKPARAKAAVRASAPVDALELLARVARGDFPSTVYLEGADEAVKAAFLAEFRRAWAAEVPDAPQARIMRPDENDVDAILAAYQNVSLFAPRELSIVFDIEDLGRSEKRVAALAAGLALPAGGACLVLVESGSDSVRKTLAPLRAACSVRVEIEPPSEQALLRWARLKLTAAKSEAEPGALEALLETCERDALAFLNEVGKLAVLAGREGRVSRAHVAALTAPRVGADMPGYLHAVASGDAAAAAQRLERLLAAGENEGSVLWALGNLVAGSFGGWSRWKELAFLLARRRRPHELARALDAVYRAESAWKGGRTDVRSALEQATREVAAG
jgi:DNA polymerase III delta subunit